MAPSLPTRTPVRRDLSLAALLLLSAAPLGAQAQAIASASIQVPTLLRIEVTDAAVAFPAPGLADFSAGFVLAGSGPPRVRTRGNVPHRVQLSAATAVLTGSAPEATKPVQDLQWSTDGAAWTSLGTSPVDLALLPPGLHPDAAGVRFRLLLDLASDLPATYHVDLVFTAVPQ